MESNQDCSDSVGNEFDYFFVLYVSHTDWAILLGVCVCVCVCVCEGEGGKEGEREGESVCV